MTNYFRSTSGQVFRTGIGGTYPCNDGDPQNDDQDAPGPDDFDEPEDDDDAELDGTEED